MPHPPETPATIQCLLVFTGTGPMLLLSTFPAADDERLIEKLRLKGLDKFIAYQVAQEAVRERYPLSFAPIAEELEGIEDVCVLDFNGHQIMANFSLKDLGEPLRIGD